MVSLLSKGSIALMILPVTLPSSLNYLVHLAKTLKAV
jgi:hypothetical protein